MSQYSTLSNQVHEKKMNFDLSNAFIYFIVVQIDFNTYLVKYPAASSGASLQDPPQGAGYFTQATPLPARSKASRCLRSP